MCSALLCSDFAHMAWPYYLPCENKIYGCEATVDFQFPISAKKIATLCGSTAQWTPISFIHFIPYCIIFANICVWNFLFYFNLVAIFFEIFYLNLQFTIKNKEFRPSPSRYFLNILISFFFQYWLLYIFHEMKQIPQNFVIFSINSKLSGYSILRTISEQLFLFLFTNIAENSTQSFNKSAFRCIYHANNNAIDEGCHGLSL